MSQPRFNRAAGFRRLGARSHARLLDDQTEALVRIQHADRMLGELIGWARAQHEELKAAERHALASNQRASEAQYLAPDGHTAVAS